MTEEKKSLEDDLMNYQDKWVAILEDEERVVGSGETPIQAKAEAEANGYTETALFKVQPFGKFYSRPCDLRQTRVFRALHYQV
ncbi:MAG TPA: DUF5678 domain-containing protein [Blastocatellia bacterium]|nr:DUF5678 domain-containing protein [Blastocatellia bacterium]